jgi:uncharacterized protein (DUF302 family)
MQYIVESSKSIEEVAQKLEENIKANGFGVLHIHNLEETMHNKGIELGEACRIYEICNPKLAKEVMSEDMSMNMVLPCRISVYTDKGITKIGMINPSTLMKESSHADKLKDVALVVEKKAQEMINQSK